MVSDGKIETGRPKNGVLILVLMEYGLGQQRKKIFRPYWISLNPCFNGIWSRTGEPEAGNKPQGHVLILVLMEYGLGHIF